MRAKELFNLWVRLVYFKNGKSFDLKTYLSFSVVVPCNSSVLRALTLRFLTIVLSCCNR